MQPSCSPAQKWDVHTHTTLSPQTFDRLARYASYADFVRVRAKEGGGCGAEMINGRGEVVRAIEANAYDPAARIADCDRHGVTVQVISPTPMMIPDYVDSAEDAEDICRILNDDNAAIMARFPTRFVALGAVPMAFPDRAIREMQRIRREHGMRGIEINSNVDGIDLDAPQFFPVFEAAAALDMAVFIHPWAGFMSPAEERLKARMNPDRNWRPWLAGMAMETALAFDALCRGRVHERLPHLRVLYAHGGGAFPALLGRLEHGSYSRPDLFHGASMLDPYETVRMCGVYADTLVHSPFTFGMLLQALGAGRLAVGSDYPYPLGEIDVPGRKGLYPGHMAESLPAPGDDMAAAWERFGWIDPRLPGGGGLRALPCLTDAERHRILAGTAREWLGFPAGGV